LRGIAILLVIFYHNFGFINYFFFGWLGVDLFFVLSGFLITDILLRTSGKPHYLRNFYIRRLLRIAPLFYGSLVVFLFIVPLLKISTVNFSFYREHQAWFWLYIQNWLFISSESTTHTTALHHYWSLAVEEQFYLVWPWLLLVFRKTKVQILVIATLLVAILVARTLIWNYQLRDFNYFGFYTFTRADGLFIGSLLAVLYNRYPQQLMKYSTAVVFSLAALNFIFFFVNREYEFRFPYLAIVGYTTFAVMFALLIQEAIQGQNTWMKKFLTLQPLRFFGKYSYGLYIWHWPIYLLFHKPVMQFLAGYVSTKDKSEIAAACLLTALAVPVSVASYHLYELPFLKLKKAFS
jgi:peptidoglycan/LPS O-acetylase OafA/YrhL